MLRNQTFACIFFCNTLFAGILLHQFEYALMVAIFSVIGIKLANALLIYCRARKKYSTIDPRKDYKSSVFSRVQMVRFILLSIAIVQFCLLKLTKWKLDDFVGMKLLVMLVPYFMTSLFYFCIKVCTLLDKNDIAQSCVAQFYLSGTFR